MEDFTEDKRRALRDLETVFPHTTRGLEHGLQKGREYFDKEKVEYDAAAFSVLVRLHARDYLRQRKMKVAEIEMERVNLCGLWLKLGEYQVKIWKISGDDLAKGLQREGSASGLQLALHQDDDNVPLPGFRLALYWTADGSKHLGEQFLVRPLREDPRCLNWIWSAPILHNTATMNVTSVPSGNVDVEQISDALKKASGK